MRSQFRTKLVSFIPNRSSVFSLTEATFFVSSDMAELKAPVCSVNLSTASTDVFMVNNFTSSVRQPGRF